MTNDVTDELDDMEGGPTLEEAKAAAAIPPEPVPGSDDLPDDVRDGEAGE